MLYCSSFQYEEMVSLIKSILWIQIDLKIYKLELLSLINNVRLKPSRPKSHVKEF